MKKIIKKVAVVLLVIVVLLGIYIFKYHSLAIEGWKLFNERCNDVNPLLIKVITTHLTLGAAISGEANISGDELEKGIYALPEYADQYVIQEEMWLNKQRAFINRWDYNLLEPDYIKRAGIYQLKLYESHYNYYKVVRDFFKKALENKANGAKSEIGSPIEDMDKYYAERITNRDLYFNSVDEGSKIFDLRKLFGQVPDPNCPEENLNIPESYDDISK